MSGKIQCLLIKQGDWSNQYGSAKRSVVDNNWKQMLDTTLSTSFGLAVFIHKDTLYAAYNWQGPGMMYSNQHSGGEINIISQEIEW